jgi:hypothetical protein
MNLEYLLISAVAIDFYILLCELWFTTINNHMLINFFYIYIYRKTLIMNLKYLIK